MPPPPLPAAAVRGSPKRKRSVGWSDPQTEEEEEEKHTEHITLCFKRIEFSQRICGRVFATKIYRLDSAAAAPAVSSSVSCGHLIREFFWLRILTQAVRRDPRLALPTLEEWETQRLSGHATNWKLRCTKATGDLFDLIQQEDPLCLNRIRTLWYSLLRTLVFFDQELGVSHGDMKPENAILDEDRSKWIDFESMVLYSIPDSESSDSDAILWSTDQLTHFGTEGYKAPEQTTQRRRNGKTDLWSLGMTIFFLLLGDHALPLTKTNDRKAQNRALRKVFQAKTGRITPNLWSQVEDRFPGQDKSQLESCRRLLEHMLIRDPQLRPRPGDLLKHKLFASLHQDSGFSASESSFSVHDQWIRVHDRKRFLAWVREMGQDMHREASSVSGSASRKQIACLIRAWAQWEWALRLVLCLQDHKEEESNWSRWTEPLCLLVRSLWGNEKQVMDSQVMRVQRLCELLTEEEDPSFIRSCHADNVCVRVIRRVPDEESWPRMIQAMMDLLKNPERYFSTSLKSLEETLVRLVPP